MDRTKQNSIQILELHKTLNCTWHYTTSSFTFSPLYEKSTLSSLPPVVCIKSYRLHWQILLSVSCIYKKVCLYGLCKSIHCGNKCVGPLSKVVEVCKTYGLLGIVTESMEDGSYMSKDYWKRLVKNRLNEYEYDRNKFCKSLCYIGLNDVESLQISSWWVHASHDPHHIRQNRIVVNLWLNTTM